MAVLEQQVKSDAGTISICRASVLLSTAGGSGGIDSREATKAQLLEYLERSSLPSQPGATSTTSSSPSDSCIATVFRSIAQLVAKLRSSQPTSGLLLALLRSLANPPDLRLFGSGAVAPLPRVKGCFQYQADARSNRKLSPTSHDLWGASSRRVAQLVREGLTLPSTPGVSRPGSGPPARLIEKSVASGTRRPIWWWERPPRSLAHHAWREACKPERWHQPTSAASPHIGGGKHYLGGKHQWTEDDQWALQVLGPEPPDSRRPAVHPEAGVEGDCPRVPSSSAAHAETSAIEPSSISGEGQTLCAASTRALVQDEASLFEALGPAGEERPPEAEHSASSMEKLREIAGRAEQAMVWVALQREVWRCVHRCLVAARPTASPSDAGSAAGNSRDVGEGESEGGSSVVLPPATELALAFLPALALALCRSSFGGTMIAREAARSAVLLVDLMGSPVLRASAPAAATGSVAQSEPHFMEESAALAARLGPGREQVQDSVQFLMELAGADLLVSLGRDAMSAWKDDGHTRWRAAWLACHQSAASMNTRETVGCCLAVAAALSVDADPANAYAGVSVLYRILERRPSDRALLSFAPLLVEAVRRASACRSPAVKALCEIVRIDSLWVLRGPPPHVAYDDTARELIDTIRLSTDRLDRRYLAQCVGPLCVASGFRVARHAPGLHALLVGMAADSRDAAHVEAGLLGLRALVFTAPGVVLADRILLETTLAAAVAAILGRRSLIDFEESQQWHLVQKLDGVLSNGTLATGGKSEAETSPASGAGDSEAEAPPVDATDSTHNVIVEQAVFLMLAVVGAAGDRARDVLRKRLGAFMRSVESLDGHASDGSVKGGGGDSRSASKASVTLDPLLQRCIDRVLS